jgi:phosphatidylserine/phosphatidylglycerophosphate/cardiolipin synthase-like enzyme
MLAALKSARRIDFCSYFLPSRRVEQALEAAARRGAEVHVHLEGRLFHGTATMKARNRDALRRLRAAHADARCVDRTASTGPELHMKAAVCDGVAYLDDCNWNADDAVIRDDRAGDVRAIRNAADYASFGGRPALALNKRRALELEAAVLLRSHAKHIDVETESLQSSAVSSALRTLAGKGVTCRLLVSTYELRQMRPTLASLEEIGVQVRAVSASEKLAIADHARAWIGSANATSPYYNGDCIDWGLRTTDAHIVRSLQSRFNANWRHARSVAAAPCHAEPVEA